MPKTAIQKSALWLAIVSLGLGIVAFDAQAISIRGVSSCGSWVKERQAKGWPAIANQGWLLGFLSGLAVASDKDFVTGTDNESIFLWTDNYCQANPLKDIGDAGLGLARELIKNKKL